VPAAVGCASAATAADYPDLQPSDCVAPDGKGTRGVTVDAIAVSAGPLRRTTVEGEAASCVPVGVINGQERPLRLGPGNFRLVSSGRTVPFVTADSFPFRTQQLAASKAASGFLCWSTRTDRLVLVFSSGPFARSRAVFVL
jgi:hypothetical protein